MYDRLVFVEGPSDEAILQEWASKVRTNLSQNNVGFIRMGGVRNFAYYASEEILNFLSKRRVKMWFLIDRDEKDDREIRKITERCRDAQIIVLSRRELENYLICSRPNRLNLAQKKGISEAETGAEDATFAAEIEALANELRPIAVWKRLSARLCVSVHPRRDQSFDAVLRENPADLASAEIAGMTGTLSRAEQNIASVLAEITTEIEAKRGRELIDLIPGSDLLREWYRKHDSTFDKMPDGRRIASLMNADEIDPLFSRLMADLQS
jgi:hypothetical protein